MKKTKRFSSPFVRGILGIRKITFHKNDDEGPQWEGARRRLTYVKYTDSSKLFQPLFFP